MTKTCMIGNHDVTEDVKTMFDALVGSMDWGSGFLSSDDIKAILRVATLLGIDVPIDSARPDDVVSSCNYAAGETNEQWYTKREKALEAWRAAAMAEIEALKDDETAIGESMDVTDDASI